MYLLNPTELYYERHELLLQEARDARLARRQRAARRKGNSRIRTRRSTEFLRRASALWGRTSVPFFGA
jgi:hypothetical protein